MTTKQKNAQGLWSEDPVAIVCTPSAFAKKSLFYIQEIGYFKTDAYAMEREKLSSFLLLFTLSGRGELQYRDKEYILRPYDMLFINCGEYVQYKTSCQETWEFISINLHGNLIDNFYEQFDKHNKPVISLKDPGVVLDKLRTLLHVQSERSISSELLSSRLIVELLTVILQHPYTNPNANSDGIAEVRKVKQYLDQSYCERITLDSLADMFRLNKFNLAKNFKKQTGFSPIEYLINVRVTAAQGWLKTSDVSIVDIAQYVGIPNTSHFINLFKEHIGETPHSYRKKWGNRIK
ncbi:AraC family transcriptional regulator [Paenibacillus sp. 1-18]|uniref:AraC family transcriptional regulator n=1 Tax=Paenibacillus sp. 1-18 TaxID=1333846 RepID=UPI00046E6C86